MPKIMYPIKKWLENSATTKKSQKLKQSKMFKMMNYNKKEITY